MKFYLHQWTRREFRTEMQSKNLKACIVTVGAIEQHLEHLAMEHDWRSVNLIAERVAETLAPHVLVVNGVMAGISEHHMTHPGTLSLSPQTFLAVLSDLIESVQRAGFQNILVLNGHGGNIIPCQAVWDQFLRKFKTNLHFLSYWEVLDNDTDRAVLKSKSIPGHAQEFETSFALAAFPENVREDAMDDQADETPSFAEAESGQILIDRVVTRVSKFVQEMVEGKRDATIPPFFP